MLRKLSGALLALFIAAPAQAAEPLTKDEVGRYVDALEEIAAQSDRFDKLSDSQQQQMARGVPEEFRDIVESHGFTPQSWSRVGQEVFRAFAALEMERRDVDQKMKQARERIENNPDLSEAQKKQMLKMLEQQQKAFGQQQVSSADKAAVKPYRDQLMALTEDQ